MKQKNPTDDRGPNRKHADAKYESAIIRLRILHRTPRYSLPVLTKDRQRLSRVLYRNLVVRISLAAVLCALDLSRGVEAAEMDTASTITARSLWVRAAQGSLAGRAGSQCSINLVEPMEFFRANQTGGNPR